MNDLEKEIEFEEKYNTRNLSRFLNKCIDDNPELLENINACSNPELARKVAKHLIEGRRCNVDIEVGRMLRYFENMAQPTADFIDECVTKKVIDYEPVTNQLVTHR